MSSETPNRPALDEQLLALPSDERARLAQLLLESLDEDEEDSEAEAAWVEELVRRAEEAKAHPERLSTWEEVKARLQARLQGR